MKKCRKLLRRGTALTNHTSYCCVVGIIAPRENAMVCSVCVCVFEVGAFVLLRQTWQVRGMGS